MWRLWLFIFLLPCAAFSSEVELKDSSFFSLDVKRPGKVARNIFWLPVGSYFAPGLAQYIYGQSGAGATYTSIGGVGLATAFNASLRLSGDTDTSDLDSYNDNVRAALWGVKTYDLAGSLSLYHAFRTAVKTRQKEGQYGFLGEGETVDELMLAPFKFSHMGRWTTFVPLGLLLGGMIALLENDNYHPRTLNTGDVLFSTAISYNAGVGEEALFRGWLQPLFAQSFDSPFWANVLSSTIFAAAHISRENPIPWPQFLAGYYFGWLAERNAWTLSESIFIHTWWDIIVFTASFSQGNKKASIYVPIYQTQF